MKEDDWDFIAPVCWVFMICCNGSGVESRSGESKRACSSPLEERRLLLI